MRRRSMTCCLLLALILVTASGTALASPCTWGTTSSLVAFGPLNLLGDNETVFELAGQVAIQGSTINFTPTGFTALSTPPDCDIADMANGSLRNSTIGLGVPSVLVSGVLYSTYISVDPTTYLGTVDLSLTNPIVPLTTAQGQQGAVSATWNLYGAMNFYTMASVAYDVYALQFNGGPFSCEYGGTVNATFDSTTNSSVITATNCAGSPWTSCTGTLSVFPISSVFPFQLLQTMEYAVTSPSLTCSGQYSTFTLDLSYTDASDVIMPMSIGFMHDFSGSFEGPLNISGFTAPLSSVVQNLTATVASPASDGSVEVYDVTGTGFDQCLGAWYGIEPDTDVTFQSNGVLTGTVVAQMPELEDNSQTSIFSDGTLAVNALLSASGFTSTTYPDIVAFFLNCAGI